MNPDSIRIAIFGVRSVDTINPDSIRIEVLVRTHLKTPDQISVPCTTPYFHKDTWTPPSSSRSSPLEGGGPSTYVACNASLYNAPPLLRDLHPAP